VTSINVISIISIGALHLDAIKAQAEQAYPQECCGLLVGRLNASGFLSITRVVASANTSNANTADSFEVDPKVRFDVMRDVEHSEDDIIGHYHSHPDHPAKPSQTDINMAFEPEFIWLITSVNTGQAADITAWRLDQSTRTCTPLTLLIRDPG